MPRPADAEVREVIERLRLRGSYYRERVDQTLWRLQIERLEAASMLAALTAQETQNV